MADRLPALKEVFAYKNLVHAVAGAAGSSVAISVFYPLDVARVRIQVDNSQKSSSPHNVLAEIFEEEGLAGLFRGWFPVVTSICCSNFVYFYVFTGLKALSYSKTHKPYPAKDLLLAFSAGVVNVVTTTPLWVANTRLKLQGIKTKKDEDSVLQIPQYKGMLDALYTIFHKEGVFGLWSGTVPSMILASNPAVQFMVYEALKRNFQRHLKTQNLAGFTYFLIGALAKTAATFVTYPIQVVQARSRAGHQRKGQGLMGVIKSLQEMARTQGIPGLYKGLEAKLLQTVLMAALMFATYEKIASVVFRIMRQEMVLKKAA